VREHAFRFRYAGIAFEAGYCSKGALRQKQWERIVIWLQSPRKMMSALMSSANPDPKHNPAARSLTMSGPCSVATRGLSMLLMNGGNADTNRNTPIKRLALRFRSPLFCPGVRSESFGTPQAYRADQLISRVTRNTRRVIFKGRSVDCAMLIKVYRAAPEGERKYSPAEAQSVEVPVS
jgi:hypothetical protein